MALSGMPGTVGAVLRDTGLQADRLALEITEGLLLEETPATIETLQALRRLGVQLMLDDFGTGYSSLSYLRRYPIDALKIDRSFVHDLGEDGRGDAAIVAGDHRDGEGARPARRARGRRDRGAAGAARRARLRATRRASTSGARVPAAELRP